MKYIIGVFGILFLLVSIVQAEPSKSECKAFAKDVADLAEELGLSPATTGRELMNRVDAWVEGKAPQVIEEMAGRIEQATAGIKACDAARHSAKIQEIKGLSTKMQTAVLPWLRSASTGDSCQSLVNEAARKKASDPEGAIADLEQSVRECDEPDWLREAHRSLVTLYYARGDVGKRDYEMAREQTRQALALGQELSEEDHQALTAILARPTIEAGRTLMEQAEFAEARTLWEGYIEMFGTPDFEILFRVEQIAQGAWMLRELKDARYQLSLTCVELGDIACVGDVAEKYKDDPQSIKELTSRAFERAADAGDPEVYAFAFDMLTAWNEIEPGSYQIKKLLDQALVSRPSEERLELLRQVEQCWIPMHVTQALRDAGEDYLEEVEIAAACGEAGAGAQAMLDEIYVQAAFDKVDRLDIHAQTVQQKRALLTEVEQRLLPKIDDPAKADELRAKIAKRRERIRRQLAQAEQLMSGRYSGCTDMLATIQWNMAREEAFDDEVAGFKKDCCQILTANAKGWEGWMRSQPENMRLVDEEIANKIKLVKRYCK